MKKSLLIIGLAFSVVASAQNRRICSTGTCAKAPASNIVYPEVYNSTALPSSNSHSNARHGSGTNHVSSISEVAIGTSGNCFGPAFGSKTNLWYDKDLNSIAFMHRSTLPTNGMLNYDISTDGGTTWTIDHRVAGDTTNVIRCRYPQGVIYNPAGNTDPANAFVNILGPTTDGSAVAGAYCTAGWIGIMAGTSQIGTSSPSSHYFNCDTLGLNTLIPKGGQIVKNTGVVYYVTPGWDGVGYNDTIVLIKGVFNTSTSTFDFTFTKLYSPVCTDLTGAKMYVSVNTAWNDAGDIGYITLLGNDWACGDEPLDSTNGLIVYKTTDGGSNWTKLGRPSLSLLDPLLANGGFFCTSAFENDVVVDKNNNLHTVFGVGAYAGGGSISTAAGNWAIFDISTPDQGGTWKATLVAKPETFRGVYGDGSVTHPTVNEDSRPQASRSWDGSKLFFTWFDTDTITYGSAGGNTFPDMHSIGYDVDADMWTAEVNHTELSGTSADGGSYFGNVSYYTINNGTDECIPMVAGSMVTPPLSTDLTLSFHYISGACMSGYSNTITSTPLGVWQGQHDPAASTFNVSGNYPNPYTGKTAVDVTLAKATDVTIEITNAIGQVLSTATYKNLHSGVNTLTVDGSSLSKGLYFYTVKAGSNVVTRTMSVE